MGVFWITTTLKAGERPLQFPFDCAFADVDALADELSSGRIVVGDKLDTTDDGRGGKLIKKRHRTALGAGFVGMIQYFTVRLWEPEE